MKTMKIIAYIMLLALILSGCNFFPTSDSKLTTAKLIIGDPTGSRAGSAVYQDSLITTFWVKAYDSDGVQIIDNVTENAAVLTRNASEDRWEGTMSITLPGGDIYLHAVGLNEAGEFVYQGTTSMISNFGAGPITIATALGYSLGDRGPGGGWIFYDKGSYSDDGKMDKSWRYLETAPTDLTKNWDDVNKIDDTLVKLVDGNVVDKNNESTIILSTYDWYWGSYATLSTLPQVKEGWNNTDILDGDGVDGLSGATPVKGIKGRGRPASGDELNSRRDTGLYVSKAIINSYSDWFIPSKTELYTILSNLVNGGTRSDWNLSETVYWSSSEDTDSVANGEDTPEDAYWAWAVDFGTTLTLDSETELVQRYEPYRVRPARAF